MQIADEIYEYAMCLFWFSKRKTTRQWLAATHLSTTVVQAHCRRQEAIPMAYPVHICRRKYHYPVRIVANGCAFTR